MHIIDVFGGEKLPVSFEIFPPKGDLPVEEAREVIGGLAPLSPSFVSVTYSAGGSGNSSRTIDVAKMAQDEYGLNMMAHLTCMNADRAGIDSVLVSMKAAGIENVLALRGDAVPGATPKDFKFAKDLIPVAREAGFLRRRGGVSGRTYRLPRFRREHLPFEGKAGRGRTILRHSAVLR